MLQPGDLVPRFEVADVGGRTVRYADISQIRPLVLVCLPPGASAEAEAYASRLRSRAVDFADAAVVVTRDPVPNVEAPSVLVADQWGEVAHVATAGRPESLPDPGDLADWIQFLRIRCPECEGEAR